MTYGAIGCQAPIRIKWHIGQLRRHMTTNWNEIFTKRPDLNPPGFNEVINDMTNNPWKDPKKRARSKPGTKGRGSHFPGLKHTTQD